MAGKSLEERVKSLKHEAERLRAIREVQNIVAKSMRLHTPKTMKRTPELFALKQPDVSVEIAMWGVYIGTEQIKNVYQKMMVEPLEGHMFEHQFTTPMIQIAGDGQTAKGVWYSPGHETAFRGGKLQAFWNYGRYGADFIKEDGEWKIWHFHFYGVFMCPYYKSWVDNEPPPIGAIGGPNSDKYPPTKAEITMDAGYRTTWVRELTPDCPKPYETWDGKSVA